MSLQNGFGTDRGNGIFRGSSDLSAKIVPHCSSRVETSRSYSWAYSVQLMREAG